MCTGHSVVFDAYHIMRDGLEAQFKPAPLHSLSRAFALWTLDLKIQSALIETQDLEVLSLSHLYHCL